jgi:Tautomerase enzyme
MKGVNRNFRGGPRSDDWIVFTITDGLDHGERAKRRFYKTLVRLLHEGPGVRPADVFVMMTVTRPESWRVMRMTTSWSPDTSSRLNEVGLESRFSYRASCLAWQYPASKRLVSPG